MKNTNKIEKLKILIHGSASFGDSQKESLIARIPELSDAEIDSAIGIFEEEIADWKQVRATHEKNKQLVKKDTKKRQTEFKKMSKDIIITTESDLHESELSEAENLITTLN